MAGITQKLERMDSFRISEEKRAIAEWLSSQDPTAVHADIASKRQYDTGAWFLDATKQWRQGAQRRMWCLGMPGAGKTVLASQLIDRIGYRHTINGGRVAYIYCNYKEQLQQTAEKIYAGLLKQLIIQSDKISPHVQFLRSHARDGGRFPNRKQLRDVLHQELALAGDVWLVVDALDECREDDGTRDHLIETLRDAPPTVRWLITSRDVLSIRLAIEAGDQDERDPLTISAKDDDVVRYVEARIDEIGNLKRIVKKHKLIRDEVVRKVSGSASGMFLLAKLHMDSLMSETSGRGVLEALKTLPSGLDEAYDKALARIESQGPKSQSKARLALMWTVYAMRPLHLEELNHALTIRANQAIIEDLDVEDGELFVSQCAGLVLIDHESQLVRLVRKSKC